MPCNVDLNADVLDPNATPGGSWSATQGCPNCPDTNRPAITNPDTLSIGGGVASVEGKKAGCYTVAYSLGDICECGDCEEYQFQIDPGIIAAANQTFEDIGCYEPGNCGNPESEYIYLNRYLNCGTLDALLNNTECATSPRFHFQIGGGMPNKVALWRAEIVHPGTIYAKLSPSSNDNIIDFSGEGITFCNGQSTKTYRATLSVNNGGANNQYFQANGLYNRFKLCKFITDNPSVTSLTFTWTFSSLGGDGSCGDCVKTHSLTITWGVPPTVPQGGSHEYCVS